MRSSSLLVLVLLAGAVPATATAQAPPAPPPPHERSRPCPDYGEARSTRPLWRLERGGELLDSTVAANSALVFAGRLRGEPKADVEQDGEPVAVSIDEVPVRALNVPVRFIRPSSGSWRAGHPLSVHAAGDRDRRETARRDVAVGEKDDAAPSLRSLALGWTASSGGDPHCSPPPPLLELVVDDAAPAAVVTLRWSSEAGPQEASFVAPTGQVAVPALGQVHPSCLDSMELVDPAGNTVRVGPIGCLEPGRPWSNGTSP